MKNTTNTFVADCPEDVGGSSR